MSEFKNRLIQKGSSKDFFLVCRILERLGNKDEIDFVRNYLEKISVSNQECINILEGVHNIASGILKDN